MKKDKYEQIYAAQRNALGEPSRAVVDYFEAKTRPLHVLDLGAGQGRDALHIARAGHRVHAIDISPTGLAQLAEDTIGLAVTTEVADLAVHVAIGPFDVMLADRTLHMLGIEQACAAIGRLTPSLVPGGEFFILDEKSNMPTIVRQLEHEGLEIVNQTPRSVIARKPR